MNKDIQNVELLSNEEKLIELEGKARAAEAQQKNKMYRQPRSFIRQEDIGFRHNVKCVQLNIFDELEQVSKNEVEQSNIVKTELYYGIDTDAQGQEILEALSLLLHKHSQTTNQNAPDYYIGDQQPEYTTWLDEKPAIKPVIKTTLAEITRLRIGKKAAGTDIKYTEDGLTKLAGKPFVFNYKEEYIKTNKDGSQKFNNKGKPVTGWRQRRIIRALYDLDIQKNNTTSIVTIYLSPIFYKQIKNHYILKPENYIPRVKAAYKEVTGSTRTPDYLYILLNKLIDAQLIQDNIYKIRKRGTLLTKGIFDYIDPKRVKARQWDILEKKLQELVNVAKKIKLLIEYTEEDTKDLTDTNCIFKVTKQGEWE